jgi:hypothetical protein
MPDINAFTAMRSAMVAQRELAKTEAVKFEKMRAAYLKEVERIGRELKLIVGGSAAFVTQIGDETWIVKFYRSAKEYAVSWTKAQN